MNALIYLGITFKKKKKSGKDSKQFHDPKLTTLFTVFLSSLEMLYKFIGYYSRHNTIKNRRHLNNVKNVSGPKRF